MGGSDDPSNLIEFSIEEHAEAHRQLFEKYGKWQDEIAWKSLAGMLDNIDITRAVQVANGRDMGKKLVASGKWKDIQSLGGKVSGKKMGKIQGAINRDSGHWASIQSYDNRLKGALAQPLEAKIKGGKTTTSLPEWSHIASLGGKAAAKKSNRKIVSLNDGYVSTPASKWRHEKRTGFKHTWIENDQKIQINRPTQLL